MAAIDDILGTKKEGEGEETNPALKLGAETKKEQPIMAAHPTGEATSASEGAATGEANGEATSASEGAATGEANGEATSASEGAATGEANGEATSASEGAAVGSKPMKRPGYLDLFLAMNKHRPESDEDREKREKKEKREAIISAIGDGISALANLYFTSRGARSTYDGSLGLSAKSRQRWEKLKAEREAKDREFYEGYLSAKAKDDARELQDRDWKHKLVREKATDALAEKKEQRDERKAEQQELLFQLKYALQEGKLTEQGYRNAVMEVKAGRIAEITDAQIRRLNRVGTGGSRGGNQDKWAYYDKNGNVLGYVRTRDEAIAKTPKGYYPYQETQTETRSEHTDKDGKKTTTVSKTQKKGGNKWGNTAKIKW